METIQGNILQNEAGRSYRNVHSTFSY